MDDSEEMNILSKFGESFCELLGDVNMQEFSRKVGISYSILYKYKRGKLLPTLSHALTLADAFSCSLDYLFGLSDTASHSAKPTPPFATAFHNILVEYSCTRYRLSKETGFSTKSVDDWYHGKRQPSMDNVLKMANYFHCTLDYLVGRE